MNKQVIKDYQEYFDAYSFEEYKSELRIILNGVGIPSAYSDKVDGGVTVQAIKALDSGYEGMSFDSKRYITQVTDQERALILICLLVPLKKIYEAKQIDETTYYETLSDLRLRIGIYHEKHSDLGLTQDDGHWLIRIFYLGIFKLGSLQFERLNLDFSKLNYPIDKKDEQEIDRVNGKGVLSVHIMKGVDFSPEKIDNSFALAKEFFEKHFSGHDFMTFYCASWMLYPQNRYLLSEGSNILDFASRFQLIGESNIPDHGIIFIFDGDINIAPVTGLQSRAQLNPEYLGVGLGIIPLSKGGIRIGAN